MKSYLMGMAAGAGLLVGAAGPVTAASISTFPNNTNISNWGDSNPSFGQTFTATVAFSTLQSITFEVTSSTTRPFQARVFQWNGTNTTGPSLFQSGSQPLITTSTNQYTVNTGNLSLTPGLQYIAFFTLSDGSASLGGAGTGSPSFTGRNDNPYGGGTFVYNNTLGFSGGWFVLDPSLDAAFTLAFADPVPEASHVLLAAVGGLALVGFARRRLFAAA